MKSSFLLLSILTVTAIGIADAQQASAQGARYKYAPNLWQQEKPRVPGNIDAPRAVMPGSVPQSPGFLGLDPAMLSRPVQTPPAPRLVAKPVPSSQISHKLFVPSTTFKSDFGKPAQPLQAGEPLKMATLPLGAGSPIPQMAAAPPTANKAAAPVHHATNSAPARHIGHHTAVSGKLKTPTHAHGESATPIAASYSSGYVPGGLLPAQSGYGMKTHADVSGVLKTKMH
jgi:hypothetical protein